MGSQPKHSKKALNLARDLYMEYTPLSEIAKAVDIPRTTLLYWEREYWKPERELRASELFASLNEANKERFTKINKYGVDILTRCLESLSKRHDAPTTREANDVVKIMDTLEKWAAHKSNEDDVMEAFAIDSKPLEVDVSLDPFAQPLLKEPNEEDITSDT